MSNFLQTIQKLIFPQVVYLFPKAIAETYRVVAVHYNVQEHTDRPIVYLFLVDTLASIVCIRLLCLDWGIWDSAIDHFILLDFLAVLFGKDKGVTKIN